MRSMSSFCFASNCSLSSLRSCSCLASSRDILSRWLRASSETASSRWVEVGSDKDWEQRSREFSWGSGVGEHSVRGRAEEIGVMDGE